MVRNLAISPNIAVVPNPKQASSQLIRKLYTYGLDRQWATATSAIKSNYFRCATITFIFTNNELLNVVDL